MLQMVKNNLRSLFTLLFVLLLMVLLKLNMTQSNDFKKKQLNIAFAGSWKSIHPGLQHTLIGDLTLSNQFESLIGMSENGIYEPLAAKDWTISSDFKTFRFTIDTNKKFSDGVHLTAHHFKNSWEMSLGLESKSSNNSLLDVLYKIRGFSDFKEKKSLSGIKVLNDSTLEIQFVSPFRMALDELSGSRFAVYRKYQDNFIGTGPFVITEIDSKNLILKPNIFFDPQQKETIMLSSEAVVPAIENLKSGHLDVIAYTMGSSIPNQIDSNDKISIIIGQDALHRAIYLNSQKNYLFQNLKYRQAFQYLVFEHLSKNINKFGNPAYSKFDMQVFLPLQAGRLNDSEVFEIIREGRKHVPEFLNSLKKYPPILIETNDPSIKDILESIGINISKKSRTVLKDEIIDIIYQGKEADIIPGSFGISNGDPDGIYHKLGNSGAIASPMTKNKIISELLEIGRNIIETEKVDDYYKNVSRKILYEVPLIHLGYVKAVALYRNDKVSIEKKYLRRNQGQLKIFKRSL